MICYILIFLMIAVGLLPMAWEAKRNRFDLFNLKNPFILYYILQLGISGWVTIATGQESIIGLSPLIHYEYYIKAFLYSLLGLAIFQIGYYYTPNRPLCLPRLMLTQWNTRRIYNTIIVFFIAGLISFIIFLRINGGLATFLTDREGWRSGGMVGQGFLFFPFTTLVALACLLHFIITFRRHRPITISIIIFLCSSIPAFLSGFRGLIALPIIQVIVLWNYVKSPIQTWVLILIFSAMGFGFTLYGITREIPPGATITIESVSNVIRNNPEIIYGIISRSKGAEVFAAEIRYLEKSHEYDLGWKSVIETVTIFIPKSVWHNKPTSSSVRFTTQLFGNNFFELDGIEKENYGGVSPTAIGEFYWHFGIIGSLLGMCLLGCIAKVLYCTMQQNITLPSCQFLYPIIFTSFAMFAEALQGYVNGLFLISIVTVGIFVYFSGGKIPSLTARTN